MFQIHRRIPTKAVGAMMSDYPRELYRMQFDPQAGTVHNVQLIRRWVMVSRDEIWTPPRAAFTYASRGACQQHVDLLRMAGVDIPPDLRAAPWRCWPRTNCPVYRDRPH